MEIDQRDLRNIRLRRTLFERTSHRNYRRMIVRGKRIVERLDPLKLLIHDKSVNYLDLAVKPSNRNIRRDHVKFGTIRKLPPACAEYLIAESEIPETSMLGRVFSELDELQWSQLYWCKIDLLSFLKESYSNYTRLFLERFMRLERNKKRSYIHVFLNTHRNLGMSIYSSTLYQSFIHECTSPEPDPALTMEVLRTLCPTNWTKSRAFMNTPHESLETMLSHAKDMRFDFWGLWRGIDDFSTKFNPIAEFINFRRHPCTTILLKYGFPYLSSPRIYEKQCLQLFRRRWRNGFIIGYDKCILLQRNRNRARMMLILTTFMALADFAEAGNIPENVISTLVCLMRCVPDPYVTRTDMFVELNHFLLPEAIDHLNRVCFMYRHANVYDEDYTVFQPRKLAHLCRCVIRRAIANNLRLPEGINELIIPTAFKTYLSLKS